MEYAVLMNPPVKLTKMKNTTLRNIGLFLLAAVFSTGLMFAFIELPLWLDKLMQSAIHTPHSDPSYDSFRIELFYDAYAVRLIGYICLAIILALIILGFSTRKTALAWIGGLAMFLPVFATFAYSMFYLAGLGLFNVIILPFLDISISLIDLGRVVLIPYNILMWFFELFNWNAYHFLVYLFMGSGVLIFVLGVFTWLQTRSGRGKVAANWLYRYSRHPQYLGWIIWSYGLMLYGPSVNDMKKSWGWHGTLPWLLSTMVIIGICMLEELKMKERAGKEYDTYRNQTPFLFPIPGFLKKILNLPLRLIYKTERPGTKKQIGTIVGIYTILLMAFSLIWVDLSPEREEQVEARLEFSQGRADSLLTEIRKPQSNRERSMRPYHELASMGSNAYPLLIELFGNENAQVREFAIMTASDHQVKMAGAELITALHDSIYRNRTAAIRALGNLQVGEATDTLLYFLENNIEGYRPDALLEALARLGSADIMPYMEEGMDNKVWHEWGGRIRTMMRVNREKALSYVYSGLESDDPEVRKEAVYILLSELPPDAVSHLEKVCRDREWEVRFYAKQAIKLIRERPGSSN